MESFDFLICEYPLPLPDVQELKAVEWDEFIFVADKVNPRASETEEYQVADNGFLYRKTIANNETGSYKINQHEITREISFFGAVKGKDCDYALEFLSLFYKGELKELKLIQKSL